MFPTFKNGAKILTKTVFMLLLYNKYLYNGVV